MWLRRQFTERRLLRRFADPWPRQRVVPLARRHQHPRPLGPREPRRIDASISRYGINADYRRAAEVGVATAPWHLEVLQEDFEAHESMGDDVALLGADQMQARVHSPTYLGGLIRRNDLALVDPARLCWGLRAAAESLGATTYERSPAVAVAHDGAVLKVSTPRGTIQTRRVVVATNAYPGPIRRPRRYIIPVMTMFSCPNP